MVLDNAYTQEENRTVLKLNPKLAPYKAAVFPLLANKPELTKKAKQIFKDLSQELSIAWDDRGNIGKRYLSQDEIGTPFCVTVDFQSLEDEQVTIRERDTMNQIRIPISELRNTLQAKLEGEDLFVLPPGGQIWKEGQ